MTLTISTLFLWESFFNTSAFSTMDHPQVESCKEQKIFLNHIPVPIIVS